jgi:hypothetical protein
VLGVFEFEMTSVWYMSYDAEQEEERRRSEDTNYRHFVAYAAEATSKKRGFGSRHSTVSFARFFSNESIIFSLADTLKQQARGVAAGAHGGNSPQIPNNPTTSMVQSPLPDAHPLTCAQVAAEIMRSCDYIARAHMFSMLWLRQRLQPQLLPSRLTAKACASVTAAARLRVRCNDLARLSLGLATNSKFLQSARDRYRLGEVIIKRVYSGYCNRVQVQQCDVYTL